MVCEWMNEWMNECSRSKCCCNCSQSQNVNSLLLRVPLQPFGFSQQTAIRGITVGSQILWTAEFRILRFCDSPFRYRRFDNSLLRYHMATKLASPPLVPLFTVHVTLGSARFSLLDKWGCLLFSFHGMRRSFGRLFHFMLPENVCVLSKKTTSVHFYPFSGSGIF